MPIMCAGKQKRTVHTLVGGVSGDMDLSDTDPSLSLLLSLLLLLGGSGLLTLRFLSASITILPALSTPPPPPPPPPPLSLPLLLGSSLDFLIGGGLRSGLSFEALRCLLDCLLSSSVCLREAEGGGALCLCFSLGEGEGEGEGEGDGRLFRFLGGLGGDMERDLERDLEWVSDKAASDGELDRLLAGDGERCFFARL